MKIAILINTHKNKKQVQRLIDKLHHPKVDIFIHADQKFDVDSFKNAKMVKKRFNVSWGDINQILCIIESLREIVQTKYDRIIYISGQDYPIKKISNLVSFLEDNKTKEFITYSKIGPNENEWHVESRYNYYHFLKHPFLDKVSRHLYHNRSFIKGYDAYGGSAWWMLTEKAIKHLIETFDALNLKKRLKSCICGDEMYVQTIMANSPFKKNMVNNNYVYVDWSDHINGKNIGNPNFLLKKDFKKIMASDCFFARKFDINTDEQVLNMIDEAIK